MRSRESGAAESLERRCGLSYDRLFRMKSEAIAFGIAGMLFGLIAGWIIGSQQASRAAPPTSAAAAAAPASAPPAPAAAAARRSQGDGVQERSPSANPTNAAPRVAARQPVFRRRAVRRRDQVVRAGAHADAEGRPDVSTELGVAYYYTNQTDRALAAVRRVAQGRSEAREDLLNQGIVRAFGKQDLTAREQAWQQVVEIAPDSPEGQAAQARARQPAVGASRRQRGRDQPSEPDRP